MKAACFLRMSFCRMSLPVALMIAMTVFARGNASAQQPNASRATEAHCQELAAKLVNSAATEYRSSLINLQSCQTEYVTEVLLQQWSNPPADKAAVRQLGVVTGRYGDQRLFDATEQAALNTSFSREQRVSAFRALVAYFNPKTVVEFRRLNETGLSASRYVLIGSVDHPARENGRQPLRSDSRRQVIDLLKRLSQDDPDPVIRTISRYLSSELAAD